MNQQGLGHSHSRSYKNEGRFLVARPSLVCWPYEEGICMIQKLQHSKHWADNSKQVVLYKGEDNEQTLNVIQSIYLRGNNCFILP
jgi:hypothetical protein